MEIGAAKAVQKRLKAVMVAMTDIEPGNWNYYVKSTNITDIRGVQ